ncbi:hypothetical protein BGX29_007852 [Mortierella sp. GBA35]|nr:hypothetical protein BGX29_007852 [Mortierella sp. GBA35]
MTESESAEAQYALVSPILEGVFKPPQQSLFGSKSSVKAEHEWAAQQHLWLLIRQNHSLRSLILDQLTNQIATFANFDFYYDTLSALKELTELKSHLYSVSPLRLLDHIPSLQRLSTFKSLDIYLGALNKRTWTNIRALECVAAFRHQGLLHALRCLPNLEDLKATWVYERTPGPFSSDGTYDISRPEIWVNVEAILGTTPTRLRRLSLSLTENTQKALPLLIPLCPDLVEITIPKLDHSIATALASYCPSLQIFRIGNALSTGFEGMGTPRPVINVANILFSNCRHLRIFDGIHHAIKIDLLQDQPWVCPNLEVLRCQFVGFERLNNFEQQLFESALRSSESVKGDLTRVYKKYEQSKCQHELFFSTLAQLWNLRFLDIGQHHLEITRNTFNLMYPCNPEAQYVHVVPDSPSLTLFYGLDQLASLTKLENFSFEGINHRMEEQDITWIATHWSKLKWILGLDVAFTLPGYELSSKYMRNVLQKTIQRLRPDIERQPSRVVVEHGPF